MVFKDTSTDIKSGAWTLLEMMVAMTLVATLFVGGMVSFTIYSSQTLAALYNYTDLDSKSQNSLDLISKEVRQADSIIDYATDTINGNIITNRVRFWQTNAAGDGVCLVLWYDKTAKTLLLRKRQAPGVGTIYSDKVILRNCTYLNFSMHQRNVVSNTFNQFPYSKNTNSMKLLQVNWTCRRQLVRSVYNSESVQSMKVVLRKQ